MEKAPIRQVIELTGLPEEATSDFLQTAFKKRGLNVNEASLDDLREVLADMLQDLILETADH